MVRLTLAQRIVAITAAALLPILGALLWNEITLRQSRGAEIHALALATAEQAALELERLTSGAEGILQAIATNAAVQDLDDQGCTEFLTRLGPELPQFTRFTVLDQDGIAVCGSDPAVRGLDLSDRPYFARAVASGEQLVVGEYTVSRVSGAQVLPLALAILGEDSRPLGVVATALDLTWLGATLRDRQLAKNGSLTIADRNGVIIAREPLPEQFVGTTIPEAFQPLVNADAPSSLEVTSQDGTQRILGFVPVSASPMGLYISTGIARDEAFGPLDAATRRTLAFFLAAAITAGLLAWLLGQGLVRGPVAHIAVTLASRRAGNDAARTGMRPQDGDIEALGAAFDGYMDELTLSRQARDRAGAELRATAAEKERLAEHNELLAREMSHRVMNSFQLMESIFALQTRRVRDPAARQVIGEAEERLRAMALVHRQLFRATRDEMQPLEARAYLQDLTRELATAFVRSDNHSIEVAVADDLELSPAQGVAVGLLVTELVINAMKHAFTGRDDGTVRVSLHAEPDGQYRLVVADDGKGLPALAERDGPPGLGMRLLESFVSQLGGELAIEGPPGARFVVTFPTERSEATRTESARPQAAAPA